MPLGQAGWCVAFAVLVTHAVAGWATTPTVRPSSIASGAVGGIYQPIADTLARIARETPGLDLPLSVEATGASAANVQLLSEGKVQLALAQNDSPPALSQAPPFRPSGGSPARTLRAMASVYPEYVQIVASKASGVGSVEGFRGKRVAIGPEGSGTEQNALQLLKAHGFRVTASRRSPASTRPRR